MVLELNIVYRIVFSLPGDWMKFASGIFFSNEVCVFLP